MDFINGLLENPAVTAAIGGTIAAVFAFLWARGRKLVAKTENKLDDLIWEAFDQGYEAAKGEKDIPAATKPIA